MEEQAQAGLDLQSKAPAATPPTAAPPPTLGELVRRLLSSEAKDRLEGQEFELLQAFWEAPSWRLGLEGVMRHSGASHTRRISGLRERGLVIEIIGYEGHSPIYELQRVADAEEWKGIFERREAKKAKKDAEALARAEASGWKAVGDGAPAAGDLVATKAPFGYSIYVYNPAYGFSAGTELYQVIPLPVGKK